MNHRKKAKNNLREFRKDRWVTQEWLAKRAGVAQRTIVSIEKGFGCRDETKRKILKALGIAFSDRRLVFPYEAV